MLKPQRIIICYGTNNLGGSSTDRDQPHQGHLFAGLAGHPDCVAPTAISSSAPSRRWTTAREHQPDHPVTQVDAYNAALVTMCEENGF